VGHLGAIPGAAARGPEGQRRTGWHSETAYYA
jgi:hypothetical protein